MGEKTTIEIENLRDLKQHALDTNKTLKQLINEAINEKIIRERQRLNKGNLQNEVIPTEIKQTGPNQNSISELKNLLSSAGLLSIVEKECIRHKVHLNDLKAENITPQLMSDIHTAITLVFDDETAEEILQKIKMLLK
jgi:hypothetical protein